jgi:hypothetical protein
MASVELAGQRAARQTDSRTSSVAMRAIDDEQAA